MTTFVLIASGVVTQKQPYHEDGFVEAPDWVVCGMLKSGGTFVSPAPNAAHVMPDLAPYQFRAMLALSGRQAALETYIDALPDPGKTIARAKLEYSLAFKFDNDLVRRRVLLSNCRNRILRRYGCRLCQSSRRRLYWLPRPNLAFLLRHARHRLHDWRGQMES